MTTIPPSTIESTNQDQAIKRRGALRGGIFGYYVGQFDIFLPIITLAPAMSYLRCSCKARSRSQMTFRTSLSE
jgi:hypothetical protein